MKAFVVLIVFLTGISTFLQAQRKWTGAIDGAWENPSNWEPFGIPAVSDEVVIDNAVLKTDYTVTLPNTSITVVSVAILPDAGKVIRLLLPSLNVSSPAVILTGRSDALILGRGAIFRNASGLTSGQSLRIAGTIKINDGGTYIHNTRSAHAADIVAKLSVAEGTEEGVFEFDIPVASSTISLSNRSFGKLKLSATTYNGNVSYSGGGSNPVTIRSDLEIGERVNFSIGFANVFTIKRNLVQNGGTFNISNDNNATVIAVGGHIQQVAGQLTETGNATPVLLLNGSSRQELQFATGLPNEIILRMDNTAGAELKSPLAINHRLELKQGKIKTSIVTLLTLLDNATLQADSLSDSFIDGPLRKQGLNRTLHFLFPVGKETNQRWVELRNATGNFVINYKQQNPYDFSTVMDQGLHHVSSIETWTIDADPFPPPEAAVELSFDNMHSGGVSDVNSLRVAGWIPGIRWSNHGNQATSGSAGASGSVTSNVITDFNAEKRLFTLGSSVSNHNTLPQELISFSGKRTGDIISFEWEIPTGLAVQYFVIEGAEDGFHFTPQARITVNPGAIKYSYRNLNSYLNNFFRIKVQPKDASVFYSNTIYLGSNKPALYIAAASLISNELRFMVHSSKNDLVNIHIHDRSGRLLASKKEAVIKGENKILTKFPWFANGIYFLTVSSKEIRQVMKLIKCH